MPDAMLLTSEQQEATSVKKAWHRHEPAAPSPAWEAIVEAQEPSSQSSESAAEMFPLQAQPHSQGDACQCESPCCLL